MSQLYPPQGSGAPGGGGGGNWNPTATETLQNKTVDTDLNTIGDSVTNLTGDILVNNGTKFVRKARGSAFQAPSMNSTGNDIIFNLLTNSHIDPAAAIAYSKLSLTNNIVNADISSTAAIAKTKLAALSIVDADVSSISFTKINRSGQESGGLATITTNGTTTSFAFAHGLSSAPGVVSVIPKTADARGNFYVTVDATNITVVYAVAPPTGSNQLWWNARVSP